MSRLVKTSLLVMGTFILVSAVDNTIHNNFSNKHVILATQKHKQAKNLTTGKLVKLHDLNIKITKWQLIPVGEPGNEYGDKSVIAFWYRVTNKTSKKITPYTAWSAVFTAYQEKSNAQNISLEEGNLPDNKYYRSATANIKKGKTAKGVIAYNLDSETIPVLLEARKGSDIAKLLAKENIAIKGPLKTAKARLKYPWSFKENTFNTGNMSYKLISSEIVPSGIYDNKKSLLIHMDVTNGSKKALSPLDIYTFTHAYQNTETSRVELVSDSPKMDENGNYPYEKENDALYDQLQPGKTTRISVYYGLENNNTIEVDFTNSNTNHVYGKKFFPVK